ncbi:MAG: (2Fe-2S)-binding protein, partial [Krumholzibacteria bacterium]|nr:(2Fe-2S)-binding protein [Candidatus Krumholzibacteria bacterium]
MAKLTIDGRELEVPNGTRLFDACTLARGEALPHFCYHPDLSVAGVCRLCQVEVEGIPKLTIACNTLVKDGMVVHTRSERVRKAAQQILEMHLINHPVDCPICDQAGECGLQDQYMNYGLYDSEVEESDKVNKQKVQVIGPQVILDKERCVLCTRCVRFCDEVTGTGELGIFYRGDRAEIGVAPGVELDNNYSVNTVDICPVGALTSRDFRFQKRVWMLKSTESVCPGCATGCNVRVDHEAGRIYRLKPRHNAEVNGPWMCDLGRLVYKAVHDEKRLADPAAGDARLTWADAGARLAGIAAAGIGLVVTSPHQTLEELWLLRRAGAGAQFSGGLATADRREGDAILLDADRTPNRAGLALLGLAEDTPERLAARIAAAPGAVLVHGGDPAAEPAVKAALAGRTVVYLGTHLNETAGLAALVLPGVTWAEKAGIMVNRQGRLQELRQAVARAGNAREDWRVLGDLLA